MKLAIRISVLFCIFWCIGTSLNAQVLPPAPVSGDSILQKLTVEVSTLMEISRKAPRPFQYEAGRYPESGVFDIKADEDADSFRVRANHSFIVSVQTPENSAPQGFSLETIKEYSGHHLKGACTIYPLSAWEQKLSINCYCSTDQWFKITQTAAGAIPSLLIYSATAP